MSQNANIDKSILAQSIQTVNIQPTGRMLKDTEGPRQWLACQEKLTKLSGFCGAATWRISDTLPAGNGEDGDYAVSGVARNRT